MEETVQRFKVSCFWKVVIVFVALGLASLIVFSIPPSPDFSVVFASATLHQDNHCDSPPPPPSSSPPKWDLDLGFSVTNFAIDRMVYDQITATAFNGEDRLATAELMPLEQRGGEHTAVWFCLENATLPPMIIDGMSFGNVTHVRVELRAKATYMGGKRQETPVKVVCEDVKVVLVSSFNATWHPTLISEDVAASTKCDVSGIWCYREQWLFLAFFVVPVLLFILALYCENFLFSRNFDDSMSLVC